MGERRRRQQKTQGFLHWEKRRHKKKPSHYHRSNDPRHLVSFDQQIRPLGGSRSKEIHPQTLDISQPQSARLQQKAINTLLSGLTPSFGPCHSRYFGLQVCHTPAR